MENRTGSRAVRGTRGAARAASAMLTGGLLALAAAPAGADGESHAPWLAAYRAPQAGSMPAVVVRDPAWRGHVRGRVVGHAAGILTLETPMGVLHFAADSVECWGAACPQPGAPPG